MNSPSDFFDYVQDQLSTWATIDKKPMFGVLGIYRDGLMFGIIKKDTVYLKVDDVTKKKFIDEASESLKVFKNNSEVPTYYKLPDHVLDNETEFVKWAKESYDIQMRKNG
jgi:DNA transformation protein